MTSEQSLLMDVNLMLSLADVCRGLRPKFAAGTPKCYIEFAEKCMDSDPQIRPSSWDVYNSIKNCLIQIGRSDVIKLKVILNASKVIKSMLLSKHPDEMYSNKIINAKLISNEIKVGVMVREKRFKYGAGNLNSPI
ncbi:hypothetical protein C2G38_2162131 [Gigaspora rosea]|uniref:Serine-threonine/tyrosine-protein kinase catalytic domain-containing protein n=1 Tax=Gigaspora rosea TaxID=44941 RepID=A0A397VWA7_9GLOM|nr:hypothetical protein C2G38_2162131 [Gigaspora rosea]